MGTLKKGLLGEFSGKLGGVVGSSWKGIPVVKKLPARRKSKPSAAQLEQRARFGLLVNFFKPMAPVLNKAFEKSKLSMTGVNKAISENKNVLTGIYPNFRIDYTNVILCKGNFRNPEAVTLAAGSEGKLKFTVEKNALYGFLGSSTLFFIAAYEEESLGWIYKMNPELSDDQTCELDLKPFRSKAVHTYAGIMPPVGRYSTSLYTGRITVQ